MLRKINSAKAKIWHVCSNRWNSAITEYALSCARSLMGKGYDTLFTPLAGTLAEQRAVKYQIETKPLPHFGLSALPIFRKIEDSFSPDIIFVYGGAESFLSKFRVNRLAKIIRIKGSDQDLKPSSFFSYVGYRHVDSIVLPSNILRRGIHPYYKKNVVKVFLGVDQEQFHYIRSNIDPPNKETSRPEITILARLDPIKGHNWFFKIFKIVLDQWRLEIPKPVLHVVGLPANISELELAKMAEHHNLKIGSDVIFSCKRIGNLAKLLSQSTLGVVPSIGSEVICRVAEEFLLCGTPILVSGVGGLNEVLADSLGDSFQNKSEEDCVNTVIRWVSLSYVESNEAKMLRASNAKNLFSLDAMAENLESQVLSKL